MKARNLSALFVVLAVALGVLATGCASSHKEFAYVVGQGTNEVFAFQANRNGTLVPLGAPNFPAGSVPVSLAVHTSGDFLYVANFAGSNVTQLNINTGNGQLSVPTTSSVVVPINPINIFNTGANPISVAMSPTDPFLFVANQTAGTITSFTVDPTSGSLNLIAPAFSVVQQPAPPAPAIVVNPQSMAVSPKGNFLFVANALQGTVAVLTIDGKGNLGYAPGSPFAVGVKPNSVVAEQSGRFLYVADSGQNAVLGFTIQSNGALTPISGSPFASGGLQTSAVAADPQGALLFAANTGSNNVSAFVIDSNTGALGALTGSPFATGGLGPSALAVNSNSTVVYVTDQTTHDIAAFAIQGNGTLKPVGGSPFPVAAGGSAIVLARE